MDFAILHSIHQQLGHPVLDAIMPIVTVLGEAGALWIVLGVALLFKREYRFWGIVMLAALAMVTVLNELVIKFLVARPRPFVADPTIELLIGAPIGYSFPSGHTGTSFAAATVIAFMPIHRGWKVAAWLTAIAIAFSRLYLFVHYPTDVFFGAVLGVLYGVIAVKVALALRERNRQRAARDGSTAGGA